MRHHRHTHLVTVTLWMAACQGGDAAVDGAAGGGADVDRDGADGPVALERFPGADSDPVADHLPDTGLPDPPDDQIVSPDGVPIASRDLLVIFAPGTTVGEANALVAEVDAVIAGAIADAGAVLLRRTVETDLETLEGLQHQLQEDARVAAVALNLGMGSESLPPHPDETQPPYLPVNPKVNPWSWELPFDPLSGNWWLKTIRMPQAWSLIDYAARKVQGTVSRVGIMENDPIFYLPDAAHPDIGARVDAPAGGKPDEHASLVAGVLGAIWDDAVGIEGVYPLPLRFESRGGAEDQQEHSLRQYLFTTAFLKNLVELIGDTRLRVINVSAGMSYLYDRENIDPETKRICFACKDTYSEQLEDEGYWVLEAVQTLFKERPALRRDFLVICSAGNLGFRPGTAFEYFSRYNSPCTNIAVRGADPTLPANGAFADRFISVEASDKLGQRANFSAASGNVSAPGEAITSTADGRAYATAPGTSFAAPQVSGLASWLWALDPALTHAQVRSLLTSPATTVPIGQPAPRQTPGSPRIDAFAAMLAIDTVRNNAAIATALVDVDDGTPDGNRRTVRDDQGNVLQQDRTFHASDARRGDGKVSMRDFRAFRDAMLQTRVELGQLPAADVVLDGDADHDKRDLNGDRCIARAPVPPSTKPCTTAPPERVYARFDFNGDGQIDLMAPAMVNGKAKTDLGVLADRWPSNPILTEGHAVGDLPGLLASSADVSFRTSLTLGGSGAYDELRVTRDRVTRSMRPGDSELVWTVPAGAESDVHVEGRKSGALVKELCVAHGAALGTRLPPAKLGEDMAVRIAECDGGSVDWFHQLVASIDREGSDPEVVASGDCDTRPDACRERKQCASLGVGETCSFAANVTEPYAQADGVVHLTRVAAREWSATGSVSATVAPPAPGGGCDPYCNSASAGCFKLDVTLPIGLVTAKAHRVRFEIAAEGRNGTNPTNTGTAELWLDARYGEGLSSVALPQTTVEAPAWIHSDSGEQLGAAGPVRFDLTVHLGACANGTERDVPDSGLDFRYTETVEVALTKLRLLVEDQ